MATEERPQPAAQKTQVERVLATARPGVLSDEEYRQLLIDETWMKQDAARRWGRFWK